MQAKTIHRIAQTLTNLIVTFKTQMITYLNVFDQNKTYILEYFSLKWHFYSIQK